jgi:DNA end-binding protein Ku
MGNTVWKGQLTFGLVSFPVRLVRAARKDRIPLRYVREVESAESQDEETNASMPSARTREWAGTEEAESRVADDQPPTTLVAPVRQAYVADEEDRPVTARELQRGYEVAPGQFAVVRSEELRRLRQPTSSAMEIVRSVRMDEIDPVFLETSYYVVPGNGGEHSYGLFYRALKESGYATLAEVAMHGRQHIVVLRPGAKGLIAHTMYYVNEVRGNEEHAVETKDVAPKELDLAKRFVEAIVEPFRPEEYTDRYREQLESLIASKETVPTRGTQQSARPAAEKVVDIMEALRKSLEKVKAEKTERKPVTPAVPSPKIRKRRA